MRAFDVAEFNIEARVLTAHLDDPHLEFLPADEPAVLFAVLVCHSVARLCLIDELVVLLRECYGGFVKVSLLK